MLSFETFVILGFDAIIVITRSGSNTMKLHQLKSGVHSGKYSMEIGLQFKEIHYI